MYSKIAQSAAALHENYARTTNKRKTFCFKRLCGWARECSGSVVSPSCAGFRQRRVRARLLHPSSERTRGTNQTRVPNPLPSAHAHRWARTLHDVVVAAAAVCTRRACKLLNQARRADRLCARLSEPRPGSNVCTHTLSLSVTDQTIDIYKHLDGHGGQVEIGRFAYSVSLVVVNSDKLRVTRFRCAGRQTVR